MLQSAVPYMLKSTVLGLGAVGALSLASSLTSASALYGHCTEQPAAADCRTYTMPDAPLATAPGAQPAVGKPVVHARDRRMLPQNG
jgi:predicted dienelactone hydrolase